MFLNCNSPADLTAEYKEDVVRLKEYDRCRNGHMLVSDFFVNSDDMEFTTILRELEDGAGAGLYYGDGCYSDYILAVVEKKRISVRIPSGVPLGDTFRYEGGKRYFELGEAEVEAVLPLRLCIKKKGTIFSVSYNEEEVLRCEVKPFPHAEKEKSCARIMLQAVNHDSKSMVSVCYDSWQAVGISAQSDCAGRCVWKKDRTPAAGVSLHLAGFRNQWTETDESGAFVFHGLPKGSYQCVAGSEAYGFWHFTLLHDGSVKIYELSPKEELERENTPQEEMTNDSKVYPLNGIWRLEWDKEGIGEKERWFCPGHHFGRRIRVPFSWQSLAAFGEEFQADSYSLHQNCSWVTNPQEMGNTVWYQREICVEETGTMDLLFAAVSGFGTVWLNDRKIGHTTSSYEPFRFSLGKLCAGETYLLTVKVIYDFHNACYCQGKQGFWFTDSPGIWQNVWLEETGEVRIRDILVDYKLTENNRQALLLGNVYLETEQEGDGSCLRAEITYQSMEYKRVWLCTKEGRRCSLYLEPVGREGYTNKKTVYFISDSSMSQTEVWLEEDDGKHCADDFITDIVTKQVIIPDEVEVIIGNQTIRAIPKITENGELCAHFRMILDDVRLWQPTDAYMYRLTAAVFRKGRIVGNAARKVGFRRMEAKEQKLWLNGMPIFIRGVLDQGYHPYGIYTYPFIRGKRAGSMEGDICKAKEYGYNLIRMHIKDNEPDWYHLCDEHGMLVWDEHPTNFYGVYGDKLWRNMYERQLRSMIRKQNYHPSIVLFSVFNESWGIMGNHELSPWEEEEGQNWQKQETCFYKNKNPHVLAIDNSGYAKSAETDILDYHMYPDTYSQARAFFGKMVLQNEKGSVFNCYHHENRALMQDKKVRMLLQGNCRIDLEHAAFVGNERQKGQPVIISEFVHTNQIEQMVRILPGIAGYIRMNLSSQENEDTSPLMNIRTERDFGYVHEDFSPAGYQMANSRNLLFPDYPPLTIQQAGSLLKIPVYVSLWDAWLEGRELRLRVIVKGTDARGREGILIKEKEVTIRANLYQPVLVWEEKTVIPDNMNALHLFFELYHKDGKQECIAENYLQMEIRSSQESGEEEDNCGCLKQEGDFGSCQTAEPAVWESDAYRGIVKENGRQLLWMSGKGSVTYQIPVRSECIKQRMQLQMEISTCECLEGTRLTDECLYGGGITFMIGSQKKREYAVQIPDAPCDRRALFSNCSVLEGKTAQGKEVSYKRTGKWGYGYQVTVPIEKEELDAAAEYGFLTVKITCEKEGMVIYGRRMGRYGVNPMLTEYTT